MLLLIYVNISAYVAARPGQFEKNNNFMEIWEGKKSNVLIKIDVGKKRSLILKLNLKRAHVIFEWSL